MASNDGALPRTDESLPAQQKLSPAHVIAEHTQSIRSLEGRVIGDVIEIGRRLTECKELLGHGKWLSWLREEFDWSERTARNFINAYRFVQSVSANVADLRLNVSSLYLLAAPSSSDEARTAALSRLKAGAPMTLPETKRLVAEFAKHPAGGASQRITVHKAIEGLGYGDFVKLSSAARDRILCEKPKNIELAIRDAVIREGWKPAYGHLCEGLDCLEKMAKFSFPKIIDAIPPGDLDAITSRIGRARLLLTKFEAKLSARQRTAQENGPTLPRLLARGRQAAVRNYGRPSAEQVLETIFRELSSAHVDELLSGKHGVLFKRAAARLSASGTKGAPLEPSIHGSLRSQHRGRSKLSDIK